MSDPLVFVSYAHEDRNLRDALVDELARWGIKVWSDEKLRTGESFNEGIAHALYQARAVVLLSSGDSMSSEYVQAEITFARKLGKRVCEVSVAGNRHPDLTDIQRVEFRFREGDWVDVVSELAPSLKRAIGPSEIFIASATSDPAEREFVDWVARELEEQGLEVWLEEHRIEFGDDREGKVNDAIDRSGVVLAVLSEASAASERFSSHVARALVQNDEVLLIIHRAESTTREELVGTWRDTMTSSVADNRFREMILERFERVVRLEPAVFVGGTQDAQLMAQVAKGLRKRQESFRPDEKVEQEVARVFKEFMETMSETGMDAAEVLSLPQFKVAAMDADVAAAAAGGGKPSLQVVDTPEITVDLTDSNAGTAAEPTAPIPKFCRKCGTRTTEGVTTCRSCGRSLLPS